MEEKTKRGNKGKEKMDKKLIIEFSTDIIFEIVEQSHRGTSFGLKGRVFVASNGFYLISMMGPQWERNVDWISPESSLQLHLSQVLFVRGSDEHFDDKLIKIPDEKFRDDMIKAIDEYNRYIFGPQRNKIRIIRIRKNN